MKHVLAALAVCAATPVFAQDRMVAQDCVQSWDSVLELVGAPDARVLIDVDPSGWCVIEDGTLTLNRASQTRFASLRWRASEVTRFTEGGLPPRSLEVYAEGIGVLPQTGNAVYDYLLGLQTEETDLGFGMSVRWDGVQNAVLVDEAYVVFDETNRVELTARIEGADLTNAASIHTSLGTAGLKSLSLKAQFDGWFESYLAPTVGGALLRDGPVSPAEQVAALQQLAIDAVNDISDDILPLVGREALSEFILDFPKPNGTLQVQVNADPVIGALRLAPLGFADADRDLSELYSQVLDGVRLLVTWSPTRQ